MLPAAAGIFSVLPAGLIQNFIPLHLTGQSEARDLLFGVFVRVSLTEELVRFTVLLFLFYLIPHLRIYPRGQTFRSAGNRETFLGAPSGLAAGLGFAAGESVFYGLSDPGTAFLRIFTAVPLHAACGSRIGNAAGLIRRQPVLTFFNFVGAFFIHGIYDFCIRNPAVPRFLPVFIALSALISSLFNVYYGDPKPVNEKRIN